MTTDKNRITAYIDNATFEALKIYCEEHNLSQSAAISVLLEVTLKVTPGTPPSDTLKEQILEQVSSEFDLYIDKKFNRLEEELKQEPVKLAQEIEERVNQWVKTKITILESEMLLKMHKMLIKTSSDTENNTLSQVSNNIPSDTPNTLQNGLSNTELARSLGVNPATTSRWATNKRQPPKDLDWEFNPTTKQWYPKTEITSTQ